MKTRKRPSTGFDSISEAHLEVLQKESKKLDMEMENLALEKQKLILQIQQLTAKNAISTNELSTFEL